MKNFYLLIALCVVTANAQTVSITDANFEQALIDLNMDSGTPDGKLDATKVMYVRQLDVANKNITDLSGIAAFVNLESINASGNQLTQVDLSANLFLKKVVLFGNKLRQININSNVWLESLNLYQNQLTQISLKNNRNLSYLAIADNQLTNLDLVNNRKLETVYCQNNKLTSLDVTDMQALNTLNCEYNNLTSLVTTNAKGLKKLVATNNFLQELHTESNLGLEHTNLMFNLLERLDFSNNANLKTLIVSHNQLQGLNIQNGNNANMQVFQAENNAELSCITADNTVVQAGATNQRWNKDGAASFALSCAGKEYVDNGAFETYLDDSKTLKFTSPTSGTALIYTLGGMPVVKSAVSKGSQEFNLSKLNEAIYILSIVGLDGSFTKKIMIP